MVLKVKGGSKSCCWHCGIHHYRKQRKIQNYINSIRIYIVISGQGNLYIDNKHISKDVIVNANKNIVMGTQFSVFHWIRRIFSWIM